MASKRGFCAGREPANSTQAATIAQKAPWNARARTRYWRVERGGVSAPRDCFAGAVGDFTEDRGFGSPASFASGNTGIDCECLKASFKERFRTVAFINLKFLKLINLNRDAAQADSTDPGGVLCGIQFVLADSVPSGKCGRCGVLWVCFAQGLREVGKRRCRFCARRVSR